MAQTKIYTAQDLATACNISVDDAKAAIMSYDPELIDGIDDHQDFEQLKFQILRQKQPQQSANAQTETEAKSATETDTKAPHVTQQQINTPTQSAINDYVNNTNDDESKEPSILSNNNSDVVRDVNSIIDILKKLKATSGANGDKLSKKLQEISSTLQQEAILSHSQNDSKSGKKYELAANISNLAGALAGSVSKFQSDDAAEISSGILDIASAISAFTPPPYGVAMSQVFSLASFVCGLFAETKTSKEELMVKAITDVIINKLNSYRDIDTKSDIKGCIDALQVSINNIASQSLNPVIGHIESYHIEKCQIPEMSKLSVKIAAQIKECESKHGDNKEFKKLGKQVLSWIYGYCLISVLKKAEKTMLDSVYAAALISDGKEIASLTGGIDKKLAELDKHVLSTLNKRDLPYLANYASKIDDFQKVPDEQKNNKGWRDTFECNDFPLTLSQHHFIRDCQKRRDMFLTI